MLLSIGVLCFDGRGLGGWDAVPQTRRVTASKSIRSTHSLPIVLPGSEMLVALVPLGGRPGGDQEAPRPHLGGAAPKSRSCSRCSQADIVFSQPQTSGPPVPRNGDGEAVRRERTSLSPSSTLSRGYTAVPGRAFPQIPVSLFLGLSFVITSGGQPVKVHLYEYTYDETKKGRKKDTGLTEKLHR